MNENEIIGHYGHDTINRMVFGYGTIAEQLSDKRKLNQDNSLRDLVARLRAKMYEEELTYFENAEPVAASLESIEEETKNAQQPTQEPTEQPEISTPFRSKSKNPGLGKIMKFGWNRPWLAAASLALFLGVIGVINYLYQKNEEKELAAERQIELTNEAMAVVEDTTARYMGSTVTAITDTLCNCGSNGFRAKFKNPADKDYRIFEQLLLPAAADSPYVSQCKKYWMGWVLKDRKNYTGAARTFDELWTELPAGEFRQRVAKGLMACLFITKSYDRLRTVANETVKEKVFDNDAVYDAKKYVRELK
jgi:hypothetical protein